MKRRRVRRLAMLLVVLGSCGRGCRMDSAEGPCATTLQTGTSPSGHSARVESCGELVLRTEWDLDGNGVFDCREDQFVANPGTFVWTGLSWIKAPPDAGCPPE